MMRRMIFIAPLAILGMLVFITLGGVVVQLLWNWLLPLLFGWPQITFWQAIGILALCRILVGGCGFRGSNHMSFRRRIAFRRRMFERWEQMTPEERDRFRQGLRGSCGFGPSTPGREEP